MLLRIAAAALLTSIVGLAATYLWLQLGERERQQFAAEISAVSYASRSELVRHLQAQMQDLRDIARYWATLGRLDRRGRVADPNPGFEHLGGVEVLLWTDEERGMRFIANPANPANLALDVQPSAAQWERYGWLLDGTRPDRGSTMLGPVADGDGEFSYRVQVVVPEPANSGLLVALIDADRALAALLSDASPGYSVSVYWGEALLYQRDLPAPGLAEDLRAEGLIRLPTGELWRVVHEPTAAFLAARSAPALRGLLIAGWVVAVLLGMLLYLNGRVRQRARDAEAAERRIALLNAELETQVQQRTRELAERTDDLETISESVVHDLRNPLNIIATNAKLLRHVQPPGADEQDELLTRMDEAVRRAAAILERMHAFSSVSFAPFQRETIDMCALVQEIFREVADVEPDPPVQLQLAELPPCHADRGMVRILLLNLLSNACKYSRNRDKRRVVITAAPSADGNVYTVADNGEGFDASQADALFEPFVRASGRSEIDGRGVGLAVVARIVRRHGGRIWAEGHIGAGARFHFHLNDGQVPGALSQDAA